MLMSSCLHLHSLIFNEVEICVPMFIGSLYFCVIFLFMAFAYFSFGMLCFPIVTDLYKLRI